MELLRFRNKYYDYSYYVDDAGLDIKHGEYLHIRGDGTKVYQCTFLHGLLHGKMSLFFENGTLENVIEYIGGIRHGEQISYHSNGKLAERCFYYQDVRHGECINYIQPKGIVSRKLIIMGAHHEHQELDAQEKLLFQIKYPGFRFHDE